MEDRFDPDKLLDHAFQPSVENEFKQEQQPSAFFYVNSGFDWNPIFRYKRLCDTFVYCDPSVAVSDFKTQIKSMLDQTPRNEGLSFTEIKEVKGVRQLPPCGSRFLIGNEQNNYEQAVPQHKRTVYSLGLLVKMKRVIALNEFEVNLYFLRADPFTTHVQLFNENNTAPYVICLGKGATSWTDTTRWDSPLGRAVAESPQPDFLLTFATERRRPDDWPWQERWQLHDAWPEAVAFRRKATTVARELPWLAAEEV